MASSNQTYQFALNALKPLSAKVSLEDRRNYAYHFASGRPMLMTSAANTLGFRTYEGYGHPPQEHLAKYMQVTGQRVSKLTNQFFFSRQADTKLKLIKAFAIDKVALFHAD